MENTILVGDHLLVNKFAYAPRLPALARLLPYRDVRRGDIIVFKKPGDDVNPGNVLVKRAVAGPGRHGRGPRQAPLGQRRSRRRTARSSTSIRRRSARTIPGVPDMARPSATSSARSQVPAGLTSSGWATTATTRSTAGSGARSRARTSSAARPCSTGPTRPSPTPTSGAGPAAKLRQLADVAIHFFSRTRWDRMFTPGALTRRRTTRPRSAGRPGARPRRPRGSTSRPSSSPSSSRSSSGRFSSRPSSCPDPLDGAQILVGDHLIVNKFLYAPRGGVFLRRLLPQRDRAPRRHLRLQVPGGPAARLHQARRRAAGRDGRDPGQGASSSTACRSRSRSRVHRRSRLAGRPGSPGRLPAARPVRRPSAFRPARTSRSETTGTTPTTAGSGGRCPRANLKGRALFVYWSFPPTAERRTAEDARGDRLRTSSGETRWDRTPPARAIVPPAIQVRISQLSGGIR